MEILFTYQLNYLTIVLMMKYFSKLFPRSQVQTFFCVKFMRQLILHL